jgi:hypothetical protein
VHDSRPKVARAEPAIPSASVSGWRVEALSASAGETGINVTPLARPSAPLFVPPNVDLALQAEPADAQGEFVSAQGAWIQYGGHLNPSLPTPLGTRQMLHTPAQPGLYRLLWTVGDEVPLTVAGAPLANATQAGPNAAAARIALDVVVLARVESETKGDKTVVRVNGKSIGAYVNPLASSVKRVREHAAFYQPPKLFALLTPETAKLRLGPDFELGQLIAFKDYTGNDGHKVFTTERHTDVLPLRLDLIEKLIKLRERLRQKGVAVTRFAVTSGFRTPDYNRQIHGAQLSRHCYGDAVDIYIDENNDHHMDDLNGDGKIDRKDGLVIANACRELELEGAVVPGGIGVYEWHGDESVRSHVHIDCRGYISRWGQIESGPAKRTFKWWPPEEFQDEENGE